VANDGTSSRDQTLGQDPHLVDPEGRRGDDDTAACRVTLVQEITGSSGLLHHGGLGQDERTFWHWLGATSQQEQPSQTCPDHPPMPSGNLPPRGITEWDLRIRHHRGARAAQVRVPSLSESDRPKHFSAPEPCRTARGFRPCQESGFFPSQHERGDRIG
jgi:hypothetical protein